MSWRAKGFTVARPYTTVGSAHGLSSHWGTLNCTLVDWTPHSPPRAVTQVLYFRTIVWYYFTKTWITCIIQCGRLNQCFRTFVTRDCSRRSDGWLSPCATFQMSVIRSSSICSIRFSRISASTIVMPKLTFPFNKTTLWIMFRWKLSYMLSSVEFALMYHK